MMIYQINITLGNQQLLHFKVNVFVIYKYDKHANFKEENLQRVEVWVI